MRVRLPNIKMNAQKANTEEEPTVSVATVLYLFAIMRSLRIPDPAYLPGEAQELSSKPTASVPVKDTVTTVPLSRSSTTEYARHRTLARRPTVQIADLAKTHHRISELLLWHG